MYRKFGLSITWDMASEEGLELPIVGTYGYAAPEYVHTGLLKPASDVCSLGMVMLEVLTGKKVGFPRRGDVCRTGILCTPHH